MKIEEDVNPSVMANRKFARAGDWAGGAALAVFVWMLLVAASANSWFDLHTLPGPRWGIMMFVVSSSLALVYFRAYRNMERAHFWRSRELGQYVSDVSWFLHDFLPSPEQVHLKLHQAALGLKEACEQQQKLLEKGSQEFQIGDDAEDRLKRAQALFDKKIVDAKTAVQNAKNNFWELHRLVGKFTHYELRGSWKFYAQDIEVPVKSNMEDELPDILADPIGQPATLGTPDRSEGILKRMQLSDTSGLRGTKKDGDPPQHID